MHQRRIFCCICVVLLAACKIEETPRSYIDRQTSAAREREEAGAEIRARILAFADALDRRNPARAAAALAPSPVAAVIGPMRAQAAPDPAALQAALREIVPRAGEAVAVEDIEIGVAARAQVAWFNARLVTAPDSAPPADLLFSGVYQRREGAWELVQAHLSTAPAPSLPADTAEVNPTERSPESPTEDRQEPG